MTTHGKKIFIDIWALVIFACLLAVIAQWMGCSTVQETKEAKVFYERDLEVCVNDICGIGAMAIPRPPGNTYKVDIKSHGRFDYLSIKTCNRHQKFEKRGGRFKYTYQPVEGIEDNPACPIEIEAFDKKNSKYNAWAFLVIDDPSHYDLQATMRCNGWHGLTVPRGTSVCQSKTGLLQRITFDTPVFYSACRSTKRTCPDLTPSNNSKSFDLLMPAKRCCYVFLERARGKEGMHLFYTIGYEESNVRK